MLMLSMNEQMHTRAVRTLFKLNINISMLRLQKDFSNQDTEFPQYKLKEIP